MADCQLLCGLWDAVLWHSWLLQAAAGHRALPCVCTQVLQPGRALGHLPHPSLPPPGSATPPLLWQMWQGLDSGVLQKIYSVEAKNLKTLPRNRQLCLWFCDVVDLKPKFTLHLLVEQARAAVGSLFPFFYFSGSLLALVWPMCSLLQCVIPGRSNNDGTEAWCTFFLHCRGTRLLLKGQPLFIY